MARFMRRRGARMAAVVAVAAAVLLFGAALPSGHVAQAASLRIVNNAAGLTLTPPGSSCNNPGYKTIQAAVNAAGTGDFIVVCPGTYTEQVTIGAGKNNLSLLSGGGTTIKAPGVMQGAGDLVHIDSSHNVTISQFTISGPIPDADFCSGNAVAGINVASGASAVITGNHITAIRAMDSSSCVGGNLRPAIDGVGGNADQQTAGIGILVGRQVSSTTGSATISGNRIDGYQKAGIVVDNTGSSATFQNNFITGAGPDPNVAQNGIQISDGATAMFPSSNTISNNVSLTPDDFVGSGLLLFNFGAVQALNSGLGGSNTVTAQNNQEGVVLFGQSASPQPPATALNGVYSHNNTDLGIWLIEVSNVTINHAAALNNGFDGILLDSTATGNVVSNSSAYFNPVFDCEDDSSGSGTAGTANTWFANNAQTSTPIGICGGGQSEGSFSPMGDGAPAHAGPTRQANHSSVQHAAPQPFR